MRRDSACSLLLSGETFTIGHGTHLSAVLWDAQHFLVTLRAPSVLHLYETIINSDFQKNLHHSKMNRF